MIPFSAEGYGALLAGYGQAIWPAQLVAAALALVALWLALGRRLGPASLGPARLGPARWRRRAASWILAGFWLWSGLVFHGLHLAALVWAAWAFAALFVLQAALIAVADLRGSLRFAGAGRCAIGGALGLSALAVGVDLAPMLSLGAGGGVPTFGLQPAALILLTCALSLAARPPVYLLILPALWAAVAGAVAWELGLWWDLSLPLAVLAVVVLRLRAPR